MRILTKIYISYAFNNSWNDMHLEKEFKDMHLNECLKSFDFISVLVQNEFWFALPQEEVFEKFNWLDASMWLAAGSICFLWIQTVHYI